MIKFKKKLLEYFLFLAIFWHGILKFKVLVEKHVIMMNDSFL